MVSVCEWHNSHFLPSLPPSPPSARSLQQRRRQEVRSAGGAVQEVPRDARQHRDQREQPPADREGRAETAVQHGDQIVPILLLFRQSAHSLIVGLHSLCAGVRPGEALQQGGDHGLGLCGLQHHEEMSCNGTETTWGRQRHSSSFCYPTHRQHNISLISSLLSQSHKHWHCVVPPSCRIAPCRTASQYAGAWRCCCSSTVACCPLCRWGRVCCSSTCRASSTGVFPVSSILNQILHTSHVPLGKCLTVLFFSAFVLKDLHPWDVHPEEQPDGVFARQVSDMQISCSHP